MLHFWLNQHFQIKKYLFPYKAGFFYLVDLFFLATQTLWLQNCNAVFMKNYSKFIFILLNQHDKLRKDKDPR